MLQYAALPDDLSSDRDSPEEHQRQFVHGYHLLNFLHGQLERISAQLSKRELFRTDVDNGTSGQ